MPESSESRAYRKIKNDIISAEYSPGVLLSENEISMNLGMSRTPVHSAIVRLEKEGYLQSLPKRGFMVKHISFTQFYDMHETIVSMEYYALARITPDTTPIDMRALERNLDEQIAALETGDNVSYYVAGFDFAATILKSAGNNAMLEVLAQFRDKLFCKVLNYRKAHPEFKPAMSRDRNEKIFEALAGGNVAGAQQELLRTMGTVWGFMHDRVIHFDSDSDPGV